MIAFEKWEGLGNDFLVVDRARLAGELGDAVVKRLCDRHRGVGADGVLLVDRRGAIPSMVVRNADGSRPEMCGNGLRCVAGFLTDGAAGELTVHTDAGDLACEVVPVGAGEVRVEAAMGVGRHTGPLVVGVGGRDHAFDTINVGNPHAITFTPYTRPAMDEVGPAVEAAVRGGTNVEFVREEEGKLRVVVWERGVGYTEACGTGAVAVAVEACRVGRAAYGAWQDIVLPGGALSVFVENGTIAARMRGPARRVFTGSLAHATLD